MHFHWSCCVTQQCLGETFIGKKWDQNSSDQSATSSNTRTLLWTQCHALKWPPAHNDTQTPAHPIECFSYRQRAHLSDYSQDTLALWSDKFSLTFFSRTMRAKQHNILFFECTVSMATKCYCTAGYKLKNMWYSWKLLGWKCVKNK